MRVMFGKLEMLLTHKSSMKWELQETSKDLRTVSLIWGSLKLARQDLKNVFLDLPLSPKETLEEIWSLRQPSLSMTGTIPLTGKLTSASRRKRVSEDLTMPLSIQLYMLWTLSLKDRFFGSQFQALKWSTRVQRPITWTLSLGWLL